MTAFAQVCINRRCKRSFSERPPRWKTTLSGCSRLSVSGPHCTPPSQRSPAPKLSSPRHLKCKRALMERPHVRYPLNLITGFQTTLHDTPPPRFSWFIETEPSVLCVFSFIARVCRIHGAFLFSLFPRAAFFVVWEKCVGGVKLVTPAVRRLSFSQCFLL